MEDIRQYPIKYIDIISYEHTQNIVMTAVLIGPIGTPY